MTSNEGMRQSAARQLPDDRQSVPLCCLRVIEFFSYLVSKVVAVGQVKEIARHDCQRRGRLKRSYVGKLA